MTDYYAVIGNPISHSKSPLIHEMFAEQTGQDIRYERIEAPIDGFGKTVDRLRNEGYKGCNVTVPFKFEAFQYANSKSKRAEIARAVNTLKFENDLAYGDNTDGAGLVADIEKNFHFPISGKSILLIGAGGAAWGVLHPLLVESPSRLTLSNRTIAKAEDAIRILAQFDRPAATEFAAMEFSELAGKKFDLVINATSAGLSGQEIPLPKDIFAEGSLAYDMMYGKETPFMAFARANGASVVSDGLGMLVEQAAEAFYIWRGVRPDTQPVIAALRK
jgi:shikimate dehydrogenase